MDISEVFIKTKSDLFKHYSPFRFFAFFCLLAISQSFILDNFIITHEVFYKSYAEQYTFAKIQEFVNLISKVKWFIYALTPILYLIKFTIVAMVLATGDQIFDYKMGFRKLFHIAMISETIFLLPQFIKLIWFLVFEHAETLRQVGSFEILSIYSMFNEREIYDWLRYPFSLANIFELTYWLILAIGIKYLTKFSFNKSLKFVLSTYVSALLLWAVFVIFLSLNLS